MTEPRVRPHVSMANTGTVRSALEGGKMAGCTVKGGVAAGHVTMSDGDTVVYRAIQKGKGQPWIVSCYNSDRITWTR